MAGFGADLGFAWVRFSGSFVDGKGLLGFVWYPAIFARKDVRLEHRSE